MCVTLGHATNNVAEYRGLLAGLQAARDLGVRRLLVTGDSILVVNQASPSLAPWLQCAACSLLLTGGTALGLQVTGRWQVHHPGLQPLHNQAMELKQSFEEFTIRHMPRCACAALVVVWDIRCSARPHASRIPLAMLPVEHLAVHAGRPTRWQTHCQMWPWTGTAGRACATRRHSPMNRACAACCIFPASDAHG